MAGFTIIIPVYNEENIMAKNTEKLIKCLGKLREDFEIIVVNNGSTDKTVELGKKLQKKYPKRFKIFSIQQKGYVGFAFRKGVKNATYDKIISLDMDLSVDLSFIPKFLKLLDQHSIVVGSKLVGTQERPLLRRFASSIFINLTRILLGLHFSDYSMAAKGYRRHDIIGDVEKVDKGSSYVIELIYFAHKKKMKIKQIPVHCFDRRRSKFDFIDETLYRFRSLLAICFRERIL